jgi:hypothetical protein
VGGALRVCAQRDCHRIIILSEAKYLIQFAAPQPLRRA